MILGFVITIILNVIFVYIPLFRIEQTVIKTANDIETDLAVGVKTAKDVENALTIGIKTAKDLDKVSKDVDNLVNKIVPLIEPTEQAICKLAANFDLDIPFCKTPQARTMTGFTRFT